MKLYKYQGAGNDFLLIDNRDGMATVRIDEICDRRYGIGADGLMLLESADGEYDFKMVYYNSDGSGGMMCGNGGRCMVAFAADLGIVPATSACVAANADSAIVQTYNFIAADGSHKAQILSSDGNVRTVRLQMKDVNEIRQTAHGVFMDTGTRHLVVPVTGIASFDVVGKGRELRYHPDYQPIGVNVNFTEYKDGVLYVRTYEKGVEDETYACGTGITASAIACGQILNQVQDDSSAVQDDPLLLESHSELGSESVHIAVQALRDRLAVDFTPTRNGAKNVWLTGPATRIAEILL